MAGPNNQKASMLQNEVSAMRRDFLKALLTNVFFLALLVALYFFNRTTGFLDKLTSRF